MFYWKIRILNAKHLWSDDFFPNLTTFTKINNTYHKVFSA